MSLWVLGGDARSRFAAQYLQEYGFSVQTNGVPERTDSTLPEVLCDVILPFPSFNGDFLRGKKGILIEDILLRTNERSRVFGGAFGAWAEVFLARGARLYDFYGAEPFTTLNAVPTAEGAICLAIENSHITLHDASCLVIGFGRCGKALAERLQALHSHVTVSARRSEDLALAESMGFSTDETAVWRYNLKQYDFIFNTVPVQVFSEAQLDAIRPECLIIELASMPGCIPESRQRFLNYRFAPALPGRFSPKTAGVLYAQSIIRVIEKERLH